MKCKSCNKEIEKDVKFCPNCGKKIINERVVIERNKDEETSLLLGGIALICSFFIGILSLPLSIISIVKYNKANKQKKANVLGVVLSVISMFIGIISSIIFTLILIITYSIIENKSVFEDGSNIENKIDEMESSFFNDIYEKEIEFWENHVDNSKIVNIVTDGNSQNCNKLLDEYEDLEEDNIAYTFCFDTSKMSQKDLTRIESKIPEVKTTTYPLVVLTNNGKVVGKKTYYTEDEVERLFRNIKYTY